MKIKNILIVGLVYLLILKVLFWKIDANLPLLAFINLWLILISIIILLYLNKSRIKNATLKFLKEHKLAIISIIIIAIIFKIFLFPKVFMMTMDEPININYAKNIVEHNKIFVCEEYLDVPKSCGFSFQAPGFGFIISIFFLLFGKMHMLAFYLNGIIGVLTVLIIYILTYQLFKNKIISLISAVLLILYQEHSIISSTANNIIPGIFLMSLSISLFLLYKKEKNYLDLLLLIAVSSLTAYVRLEMIIVPIVLLTAIILTEKIDLGKEKIVFWITALFMLTYPVIFKKVFEIHTQSLSPKSAVSLSVLLNEVIIELKNFILGSYYPIALLILSIIGLYFLFKEKKWEKIIVLIIPAVLFLIYNTYQNVGKPRFFMTIIVFLIILSAYGFKNIYSLNKKWSVIALIIIIIGATMMININQINNQKQNQMIMVSKIPTLLNDDVKNCVIITEEPLFISAAQDVKTISINYLEKNQNFVYENLKKEQCILLFKDMIYCKSRNNRCDKLINQHAGKNFLTLNSEFERYTFYKLQI